MVVYAVDIGRRIMVLRGSVLQIANDPSIDAELQCLSLIRLTRVHPFSFEQ